MKVRLLVLAVAVTSASLAIAQDMSSDKGKLSYALGYDFGRSLADSTVDTDQTTLIRAIQDGMAHKSPAVPGEQITQLLQKMKERLYAQAKEAFEKAAAANKASSDTFLAKNRAKPGVRVLQSGVQYRVIEDGNGPAIHPDSQVRILYRASISTGQEFATSYAGANPQPTTVVINESPLAGIKQVLPMMRQGAHWEIVLPPEQAYGSGPGSPIGPNQVVDFDIKIVDILK